MERWMKKHIKRMRKHIKLMKMNDNPLTSETKLKLDTAIKDILKDCNRNIYNFKKSPIPYREVRSIFNNWFARHTKLLCGNGLMNRLYRKGMPFITLDEKTGYISNVKMPIRSFSNYRDFEADVYDEISKILKLINYEKFYYKAEDSISSKGYSSQFSLDLTTLHNIKF